MVRGSFTASGLLPMAGWANHLHSRLKALLDPEAPIVLDVDEDEDEEMEMLEEANGFGTDIETDNGKRVCACVYLIWKCSFRYVEKAIPKLTSQIKIFSCRKF